MRRLARIFPRLLLFNVLLVFLPVAGLLYLDTYETQLLATQERSMVQQGRVLAAALGDAGPLESDSTLALLTRLERRVEARLRIVDAEGTLLADSSLLGPRREPGGEPREIADPRSNVLYRLGAQGTMLLKRLLGEAGASLESSDVYGGRSRLDGAEIRAALAGRYGAATRISSGGQRSVTLYSAIPVRDGNQVVGAVLVSQSTARILAALIEVRFDIFLTFLASVGVAAILSLLFSTTIARPLFKLQQQTAAIIDRRGRLKRRFDGSRRHDEIGELARALEHLSGRIEGHQAKLEAFASDVAHEFKNPLASIRTATELLAEVEEPSDRQNFVAMIERDVARMEHVLSEVRDLALLDSGSRPPAPVVDLGKLTRDIVDGYRTRENSSVRIELESGDEPHPVAIDPEHFARILTNLLDNALSLSPPHGAVTVALDSASGGVGLSIEDAGPGVAAADRRRVFDRFYSARPSDHAGGGHLGLGLSIVKAIAESYGGRVEHRPREPTGTVFLVTLPTG